MWCQQLYPQSYNSIPQYSHFGTGELHVPSAKHVAELGPSRVQPSAGTHVTVLEVLLVVPHLITLSIDVIWMVLEHKVNPDTIHRRKRVTIRKHTGSVLSLLYGIRRDIVVHGYRSSVIYVTLDTVLYREVTVYGVPQVIEDFRFLYIICSQTVS